MKRYLFLVAALALMATSCYNTMGETGARTKSRGWFGFWGSVGEEAQVQSSRNRLLSYDWYYDMYGQIKAQEANITGTPKTDADRAAMIKVLNSNIAEYNSRSRQYNHSMWKANDLPYELDFYKEESQ